MRSVEVVSATSPLLRTWFPHRPTVLRGTGPIERLARRHPDWIAEEQEPDKATTPRLLALIVPTTPRTTSKGSSALSSNNRSLDFARTPFHQRLAPASLIHLTERFRVLERASVL
jgi:hypothetical protein